MREFGRDLRVADFIRDELAKIIQLEMRDPRVGMISVNEVSVSKDLAFADVYVSSMEARSTKEREELIGVLNKASGFFRSQLAKRHSMRTTPKPRFHYDETIERGPALEALIDLAVSSDAQNEDAGHGDDLGEREGRDRG